MIMAMTTTVQRISVSKISTPSQGMFVGAVADNFGETIDQTIFHAQIVVGNEVVQKETATYQLILKISNFLDENGDDDAMERQIQTNYRQIKQDVVELVEKELIRIENDSELKHLLGNNEDDTIGLMYLKMKAYLDLSEQGSPAHSSDTVIHSVISIK